MKTGLHPHQQRVFFYVSICLGPHINSDPRTSHETSVTPCHTIVLAQTPYRAHTECHSIWLQVTIDGRSSSPFDICISIHSFATSSWIFSRESEAVRFSFKPRETRDGCSIQGLTGIPKDHSFPTRFAPFLWPFKSHPGI